VRQEYRLLGEELTRVIRRHARAVSQAAVDEGLTILMRALEQGEESSIRGLQRMRLAENDEAARVPPNSSITALDASVSARGRARVCITWRRGDGAAYRDPKRDQLERAGASAFDLVIEWLGWRRAGSSSNDDDGPEEHQT